MSSGMARAMQQVSRPHEVQGASMASFSQMPRSSESIPTPPTPGTAQPRVSHTRGRKRKQGALACEKAQGQQQGVAAAGFGKECELHHATNDSLCNRSGQTIAAPTSHLNPANLAAAAWTDAGDARWGNPTWAAEPSSAGHAAPNTMARDLKPDPTATCQTAVNPPPNTPLPRATCPAAPTEAAALCTASAGQRASTFTAAGPCTPRRSVSLRAAQICTSRDTRPSAPCARDAISDSVASPILVPPSPLATTAPVTPAFASQSATAAEPADLAEEGGAATGGGAAETMVFQSTQKSAAAGADGRARGKGRRRGGKVRRATEKERAPVKRNQDGGHDAAADAAKVARSAGSAPLRQSGSRPGKDGGEGELPCGGGGGKASSSGGARGGTRSEREGASERELKRPRFQAWQIEFLEESFLADYTLEPDRKRALAAELGVQPRQVAVWFQNRRVRWKSRQKEADLDSLKGAYDELEDDCESLRSEYELLKGDYEELLAENSGLYSKILLLTRLVAVRGQGVEQAQSEQRGGQCDGTDHMAEMGVQAGVGAEAASECERSPMHSSGGSKAMQQAFSEASAGRAEWEEQPWNDDDAGKHERETGRSGTQGATNTASTGTPTAEGGRRRGVALSPLELPPCAVDMSLPSPLSAAGFDPTSNARKELTCHGMQAKRPPDGCVAVLSADFLSATHHSTEPAAGMAALSRHGTPLMVMEGSFDAFTSLLTAPDALACEPYWPHTSSPSTHAAPVFPAPSPPPADAEGAGPAGTAGVFAPPASAGAQVGTAWGCYPTGSNAQIEEGSGGPEWEGAPAQLALPMALGEAGEAGEAGAQPASSPALIAHPTIHLTSPPLPSPLSATTPLGYLPEPEHLSLPSLPAAASTQPFQSIMAMPLATSEAGSPPRSMMALAASYASPTPDSPALQALPQDLQLPLGTSSGDGSERKRTGLPASSPCTGAQGSGNMGYLPLVVHDDGLAPADLIPRTGYTGNAEAGGAGPPQWHQSFNCQNLSISSVNTKSGPYMPALMFKQQQQQQHEQEDVETHTRNVAMVQPLSSGLMLQATGGASTSVSPADMVHICNIDTMEEGLQEQLAPPATVHVAGREEATGNSLRNGPYGMGDEMLLNNWWDGISN
ncbi:hypothetical protein CLOP_g273 [Closterium sp. NIES-67]|nr:hypothetical protein CLOP_g273 [Closterium sp. NIES-67]